VHLSRDGTFDDVIWESAHLEYPMPESFAPGEIVLDVGCHTGAVCALAATRGATVVGYEANRENHALAQFNLARYPSVTLRLAAIWRSDVAEPTQLLFTRHADAANTGGGSVLFASDHDHWEARPTEEAPGTDEPALSSHLVDAVPLDRVLDELGPVRFLKMDVEGAEFPILLTATRLDLVATIAGEYHEFTDDAMTRLSTSARVGHERYTPQLLRQRLDEAGFESRFVPERSGRGFFTAQRLTPAGGARAGKDR
jgi:FkbM family methyltransferase